MRRPPVVRAIWRPHLGVADQATHSASTAASTHRRAILTTPSRPFASRRTPPPFSLDRAGFILSPHEAQGRLRCSVPHDGDSMHKNCARLGGNAACRPGCFTERRSRIPPMCCDTPTPSRLIPTSDLLGMPTVVRRQTRSTRTQCSYATTRWICARCSRSRNVPKSTPYRVRSAICHQPVTHFD